MPDRAIIRAFLRQDDSPLAEETLLPVTKRAARPAPRPSSAGTEKKVAVRLLKDATDAEAPLSGPSVAWARKILQDAIATLPAPQPVVKAIPKQPRTAKAPPGSVQAVFQNAVRGVPQRGEAASLADAYDEAKRRKDRGAYGTPINPSERATRAPTH